MLSRLLLCKVADSVAKGGVKQVRVHLHLCPARRLPKLPLPRRRFFLLNHHEMIQQSKLTSIDFAEVVLPVDEDLPDLGADKIHAFGCALRYLRTEIALESLNISLTFQAFSHNAKLSWQTTTVKRLRAERVR